MIGVTYTVRKNDFPKLAGSMRRKATAAVTKTVADLYARGMAGSPVDTGYMRASHQATYAGLSGQVYVGASYAMFVHSGTRRMAGRPWLKQAADAVAPGFESALSDIFEG